MNFSNLIPVMYADKEKKELKIAPVGFSSAAIGDGSAGFFPLPVDGCVPSALVWGDGEIVRCGGAPEVPSAAKISDSRVPQGIPQKDLSWRSPGGVASTARVNSKNAVRWPATRWRCSLSAPIRRIRASVWPSRSMQTRGGAC